MHSFISGTKKCYFSNLSINRTFDESFMWHVCALINHMFTFLVLLQFVIAVKFLLSLKRNLKIFWNYSNLNHSHFKKVLFFHESTFVSIKTFPYISWTFHFPQIFLIKPVSLCNNQLLAFYFILCVCVKYHDNA